MAWSLLVFSVPITNCRLTGPTYVMTVKVISASLKRIANELPDLNEAELLVIGKGLQACFELGRAWDEIPILVEEAKAPPVSAVRKRRTG